MSLSNVLKRVTGWFIGRRVEAAVKAELERRARAEAGK